MVFMFLFKKNELVRIFALALKLYCRCSPNERFGSFVYSISTFFSNPVRLRSLIENIIVANYFLSCFVCVGSTVSE